MFTVDPVHARDHGPGCSVAGVRNWSQGVQEGLLGCLSGWYPEGREPVLPSVT